MTFSILKRSFFVTLFFPVKLTGPNMSYYHIYNGYAITGNIFIILFSVLIKCFTRSTRVVSLLSYEMAELSLRYCSGLGASFSAMWSMYK